MKVEFIESYIHDEKGGDYEWDDNHGELIRCKDCKHYSPGAKAGWCYRNEIAVEDNDYCSFAERREE